MGSFFSSPVKSDNRGSLSAKGVIDTPMTPYFYNSNFDGFSEIKPAKQLSLKENQSILLYVVGRPGCKMNRHWGKQLSHRLKQLKETGMFGYTNPKYVCILRPQSPDKAHVVQNFAKYVDAEIYIDSNIFDVIGESFGNICNAITTDTFKYYNACTEIEGDNNIYSEPILSCTTILSQDKILYFRREEFFGDVPSLDEIEQVLKNQELAVRRKINKEEEMDSSSS